MHCMLINLPYIVQLPYIITILPYLAFPYLPLDPTLHCNCIIYRFLLVFYQKMKIV